MILVANYIEVVSSGDFLMVILVTSLLQSQSSMHLAINGLVRLCTIHGNVVGLVLQMVKVVKGFGVQSGSLSHLCRFQVYVILCHFYLCASLIFL